MKQHEYILGASDTVAKSKRMVKRKHIWFDYSVQTNYIIFCQMKLSEQPTHACRAVMNPEVLWYYIGFSIIWPTKSESFLDMP